MRREINTFEIGWMNDESNLKLNSTFINGVWVKVNEDYFYFDIEFNKENLTYKISHSMEFKYPWCSMRGNFKCGKYTTQKNEKISKRENEIKKIIIDWFIGMYGSEKFLKSHFGDNFEMIKDDFDNKFKNMWEKNYGITKDAMKKFAEDFYLN